MISQMIFALAVVTAATPHLVDQKGGDVDQIIANLDMTTFANSIGPRRVQGQHSFADYGFTGVEKTSDGAILTEADGRWKMSFNIIATTPDAIDICFHDQGLAVSGDGHAPTYNTTSALRITRSHDGLWPAQEIKAGLPGCLNNPPIT